jgi:hypothetical protein
MGPLGLMLWSPVALTTLVAFSADSFMVGTSLFSKRNSAFWAILAVFRRFDIFLYVEM